ncbi:SusC/RagA family TonB-linked outer membrane protein [Aureibaculum sp. 2210JD6-5]|uniref:SusC/RagA family TonB-linked outer membrane protein n=1 Tax=Aureibaculum sp. 2210JD6-5 TaxID=3103957 RepID=UPI002AAD63D1|nr:SusC/RagA family TonB-linked outer membrane protein [Aureibaculum sp. 2210JD6-5]MDY7394336.1 SusC/RagA family TonB-linked outer membrane protein [Aureibaculum sp. 2210JD6-5]
MKSFIFLFCTTVFSFSSGEILSQSAKVKIDTDKIITVDEVFKIIKNQTEYTFIYRSDLFKGYPKVAVKKGTIRANKLLEKSLSSVDFNFELSENNTIIIKEKPSQQTITGKVTDENGDPLPGVTVLVKDSNQGTSTDFNGNYSIRASTEDVLVFRFVGMITTEVSVTDKSIINVTLKVENESLEEVVVVGYGSTQRKDLTGSVGSIKTAEIQQIKAQTIDQTIIGRIPGVHVSSQTGGPGSGAIVHIRGLSQLVGDNQPLYVVDGVPIVINPQFSDIGSIGVFGDRENPLLSVNPADIERVDILKDASSAAIYGSRAANGVVIITTKRGKRNRKPSLNFFYNTTVQNTLNKYDVLNASQYNQFITDQGLGGTINFGDANTDWQDEITNKNAIWNQYDLSVSGGTEKVNYLISTRVSDQEGLMVGNKFKRYNFSSSIDADLSDRLNVGANFSYNYSINKQSGLTSLARGAFFRPDLPIFNEDGSYSTALGLFGFTVRNPLGDEGKIKNSAISQNILGSAYGEYKLIKGLKFRSQLSLNINNDRSSVFSPSFTLNAMFGQFFGTEGALLDVQHTAGTSTSWSNTLNYKKTLAEKHTIDAVFGISWDHSRLDLESQDYAGFPDDIILTNINSANDFVGATSDANETALNSLFGRINYNFDDRYLATFTARYDGSIKFGPNNQRGFFPSGALAWNVHNEDFLKDNTTLNQLKLRASIGRTGSDNLPAFTYLANYQSLGNGDSFYDGINGISINGVPNSDIIPFLI